MGVRRLQYHPTAPSQALKIPEEESPSQALKIPEEERKPNNLFTRIVC